MREERREGEGNVGDLHKEMHGLIIHSSPPSFPSSLPSSTGACMMIGDRAGRLILQKRRKGQIRTAAGEEGEERGGVEEEEEKKEGGMEGKKKKRWSFGKTKKKKGE